MFDSIGETTIRSMPKPESGLAASDKALQVQKTEKLKENRPVENAEEGAKSTLDMKKKEESSKYKIEDKKIIYEKYNKDGEVIMRLPPNLNPVDEKV